MATWFVATPASLRLSEASQSRHSSLGTGHSYLFIPTNLPKSLPFHSPKEISLYRIVTVYEKCTVKCLKKQPDQSGNIKRASRKSLSIILRREATKANIEKKIGPNNSKKLLPRTVLEALTERIDNKQWESALKVFQLLREQLWYRPNPRIYTKLMAMLGRCGQHERAHSLFELMVEEGCDPNSYGKAGKFQDMENVLSEMLENHDCKPDVWTMNAILRAFGNRGKIKMMENYYEKFQSIEIQPDVRTFNILMYSYGKEHLYDKMTAVMEYMQKYYFSWTTVTYNVVIDAFGRAGDIEQMEYLFNLMRSEGVKPDCITLCSLVSAYGRASAFQKITRVMRQIENSDVVPDTAFFNSVLDAYRRAEDLTEMEQVLIQMKDRGCKPDKITFTTMIKAYSSKGMLGKVQELKQKIQDMDSVSL